MSGPQAHIDIGAIIANWRMFSRRAGSKAAGVVKADAYGLGAARIAPALARAGCTRFYVAWPHEGVALRGVLGAGPEIAVFHGPSRDTLQDFSAHDLEPVLNSLDQAALWQGAGSDGRRYSVHLDTGMNRLGVPQAQWKEAAQNLPTP